jgi:hypothetical protein
MIHCKRQEDQMSTQTALEEIVDLLGDRIGEAGEK